MASRLIFFYGNYFVEKHYETQF